MRDHVPPSMMDDDHVWDELCAYWDTPDWKKKSEAARANRMSGDSFAKPRHTGGSMGYDEHRIELENKLKRPVKFFELFLHTHLSKEAKEKFWAGDYQTLGGLEFCTSTSREAYEAYERAMIERHGEDLTQHPVGDVDVWVDSQRGRGRRRGRHIYGIGCSDLHFVVTGTSSSGSSSTSAEYEQSQRRVQELEERQVQYEAQLEARMPEERAQFQAQMAEERALLQAQLKAQMEEFMRSYGKLPNNPPN